LTPGIRFGVWMPVYGGWLIGAPLEEPEISFNYVKNSAIEAENSGFDSIWVPDHLLNPRKGENVASLEAWTTLTGLATCTRKVKLGHAVLCQGFRYPAVLAKMASTLDEISQGRFIFALGAGWMKREFLAYGLEWENHDDRVERAGEQIKMIRSLWTQNEVEFKGYKYKLEKGVLVPGPVQKPCPPIWYAGNSEKSRQILIDNPDIDGWYISSSTPEEAREKINDVKGRIGERKLECAIYAYALIGKTDQEAEERLNQLAGNNPESIKWALKPGLVGSPNKIIEGIHKFQDAGVSYLTLLFSSTLSDIRMFSQQILKHFS
jgi:dimethylsulfone monooxygenase